MFRYVEKRPFPIDFVPTPTFSVLSVGVTDDDGVVFQFRSTYTIYETFRKLQDENDGMALRLIMTLPHHNVFDSEPYVLEYLKKHPSRFLELGMYGENTFSMVGDPDVHKAMLKELRDVVLEEFSHFNQMIYIDGTTRKVTGEENAETRVKRAEYDLGVALFVRAKEEQARRDYIKMSAHVAGNPEPMDEVPITMAFTLPDVIDAVMKEIEERFKFVDRDDVQPSKDEPLRRQRSGEA
jgi:hypothetical protein